MKTLDPIIVAASIISLGLISSTLLSLFKDEYKIDMVNNGFFIRTNIRNGDRCLLKEGFVASSNDWKTYAGAAGLPNKFCK
jgi:hypothetical protein